MAVKKKPGRVRVRNAFCPPVGEVLSITQPFLSHGASFYQVLESRKGKASCLAKVRHCETGVSKSPRGGVLQRPISCKGKVKRMQLSSIPLYRPGDEKYWGAGRDSVAKIWDGKPHQKWDNWD